VCIIGEVKWWYGEELDASVCVETLFGVVVLESNQTQLFFTPLHRHKNTLESVVLGFSLVFSFLTLKVF